jgi:hypothetical protein
MKYFYDSKNQPVKEIPEKLLEKFPDSVKLEGLFLRGWHRSDESYLIFSKDRYGQCYRSLVTEWIDEKEEDWDCIDHEPDTEKCSFMFDRSTCTVFDGRFETLIVHCNAKKIFFELFDVYSNREKMSVQCCVDIEHDFKNEIKVDSYEHADDDDDDEKWYQLKKVRVSSVVGDEVVVRSLFMTYRSDYHKQPFFWEPQLFWGENSEEPEFYREGPPYDQDHYSEWRIPVDTWNDKKKRKEVVDVLNSCVKRHKC